MTAAGKPNLVAPLPPSVSFPHGILTKCRHAPGVFMLEFNKGENRIGVDFLQQTLRPALLAVEREYRASLAGLLDVKDPGLGWQSPPKRGCYALVTTGDTRDRFYSNGLNFREAFSTPYFVQELLRPSLVQLLTFPLPTICAINGHAFAGGCMLALCHDTRIMREPDTKGRPHVCMNEVEFGANIPVGTLTLLSRKFGGNDKAIRECVLEARRFTGPDCVALGLVDRLVKPEALLAEAINTAYVKASTAQHGGLGLLKTGLYGDVIKGFAQLDSSASAESDGVARSRVLGLSKM